MNYDGSSPPSKGQAYRFLKHTSSFAEATDYIKGFAYYAVLKNTNINPVNALANSAGDPTELFKFWTGGH